MAYDSDMYKSFELKKKKEIILTLWYFKGVSPG